MAVHLSDDYPMPTITERIEKLEKRLKQEKALNQRIQARIRTAARKKERKEDTRKKILLGVMVLSMIDQGKITADIVKENLDDALTRDDDRALFGLPPRSE